jgi:hypothetical protein
VIINMTTTLRTQLVETLRSRIDADAVNPGRITLHAAPMPGVPGDTVGIGGAQAVLFLARPASARCPRRCRTAAPIVAQRGAGQPIAWARIADGAGNPLIDVDVTLTGGGGAVQLDTLDGYTGAFVTLTGFVLQG